MEKSQLKGDLTVFCLNQNGFYTKSWNYHINYKFNGKYYRYSLRAHIPTFAGILLASYPGR